MNEIRSYIKRLIDDGYDYYPDKFCKCGCFNNIKIKKWHLTHGIIPDYINGHGKIGKKASNRGIKFTKEHRNKIALSQIGENNSVWTGGQLIWWRKELKKVYKECCLCKSKINLKMHHIDHNKDNNQRNNLIIICHKCHMFWHHN